MPTKHQTIADATQIVQGALYPQGFSAQTAWLGIYRALLWYEPVQVTGFTSLPHIIDADKLRPSTRRKTWVKPSAWQIRAQTFQQHFAQHLGVLPSQVEQIVDQLMKLPAYAGMQRQNSLGIAFSGVVRFVLEKFGNPAITYDLEVDATTIFPGLTMPGRSTKPMIDILAKKGGQIVAIISTKWSLRHDRINDITNECPIYKNVAFQQARTRLNYCVVTNEFDPARLSKVLGDVCVNAVVHVHKDAVTTACQLDGRLATMLDLADLVSLSGTW